uniref:Uncharacterized protein n=1 Tax=Mycena chlorophos TaxID=658473 RepID=A0ABQ0KUR0_MYCCL|nr:predicted protein [Mycena chlorophos]
MKMSMAQHHRRSAAMTQGGRKLRYSPPRLSNFAHATAHAPVVLHRRTVLAATLALGVMASWSERELCSVGQYNVDGGEAEEKERGGLEGQIRVGEDGSKYSMHSSCLMEPQRPLASLARTCMMPQLEPSRIDSRVSASRPLPTHVRRARAAFFTLSEDHGYALLGHSEEDQPPALSKLGAMLCPDRRQRRRGFRFAQPGDPVRFVLRIGNLGCASKPVSTARRFPLAACRTASSLRNTSITSIIVVLRYRARISNAGNGSNFLRRESQCPPRIHHFSKRRKNPSRSSIIDVRAICTIAAIYLQDAGHR